MRFLSYPLHSFAFTPTRYGNNPPPTIIALPVTLTSLQGYLVGNDALLQWTTASEANVKEYVVERSGNGVRYVAIGNVDAKNNGAGASYQL